MNDELDSMPPWNPRPIVGTLWRIGVLLVWSACGSGSVPDDPPDARAIDAQPCLCPHSPSLDEARIVHVTGSVSSSGGFATDCPAGHTRLGISCILDSLNTRPALRNVGLSEYSSPQGPEDFLCSWRNRLGPNQDYSGTAICLPPPEATSDEGAAPPGCACPPIEPFEDRLARAEQAGIVPANGMVRVASRCEDGTLLVGGSCLLRFSSTAADLSSALVSIGFAADGAWECVWNNQADTQPPGTAVAMCLRPPSPLHAPEAEPLAERIVRVEDRTVLPAGIIHVEEVTCAPNDFLLWGACTLETPDESVREVTILRSGFPRAEQGRTNIWQCAWNNPTELTPTAIATAVCLKPLTPSSTESLLR